MVVFLRFRSFRLTKNVFVLTALTLGAAALASAQAQAPPAAAAPAPRPAVAAPMPTKIAIINIQAAILQTKEGQKASNELQTKFNPRKSTLEKRQTDIQTLQEQLRKGSATMSDEAKAKLERDIDSNTKALNRDAEDLNADVDQDQNRLMNDLGTKMMAVIEQYATQNAYSVVLDVSNPQSPVLWAAAASNITPDIIRLYDQAHPEASAAPAGTRPTAAPPAAGPPRPAPAITRTPVPPAPAGKKQ
jgi:outer membrane protein